MKHILAQYVFQNGSAPIVTFEIEMYGPKRVATYYVTQDGEAIQHATTQKEIFEGFMQKVRQLKAMARFETVTVTDYYQNDTFYRGGLK